MVLEYEKKEKNLDSNLIDLFYFESDDRKQYFFENIFEKPAGKRFKRRSASSTAGGCVKPAKITCSS